MKTYKNIHFNEITELLMQAAMGVSAVCGYRYPISDLVFSLNNLENKTDKEPYYIAIREMGTESGNKKDCIHQCKCLGYPLVIAKIEKGEIIDYNMTIMFSHSSDRGKDYMVKEFDEM